MRNKLFLLAVTVILLAVTVSGISGQALTVWSFTDELEQMINGRYDLRTYYKRAFPQAQINYSLIQTEHFPRRLDPVLASGRGAPDVFTLEAAFVRKYVESGLLLDLTDIYERNKNKLLAYPVEVGTHNGRVYALSWQACPGAMFYRRSLARKYLGTDDPAVVQTLLSDLNKFLDTAILINQNSNGKCVIIPGIRDIYIPILFARKQPWIVNGRLVIDPIMEQYMDIAKTMHDNNYEGRVDKWSEGWFNGMKGELYRGNWWEDTHPVEVFSYFMPTWGLQYVLKTNAPNTSGDWAMIQGPVSWYWGGSWLAASKSTQYPGGAKHMIEWLTTNDTFLEAWAGATGDIVSNTKVINKIAHTYSEPYLSGQNHYAEFAKMAQNVNGRIMQGTDGIIDSLFYEAVTAYVKGEKTKAKAIADFRAQIKIQ